MDSQFELDLYIPPALQPEWEALLQAWLADFQPNHFAFQQVVYRLAAADFSARRHKRELAAFERTADTQYPNTLSVDWPAEIQKHWQTLVSRHKESERAILQCLTHAERHRKRRDDQARDANKTAAQGRMFEKPARLVIAPSPEPAPVQQTGTIDIAQGDTRPTWTPSNHEILLMIQLAGERTITGVRRTLVTLDPEAKGPLPSESKLFTHAEFRTIAERESEPDPTAPPQLSYTKEVVLR